MRVELHQHTNDVVTLSFFCEDAAEAMRMYASLGEQIDYGRIGITIAGAQPVPLREGHA